MHVSSEVQDSHRRTNVTWDFIILKFERGGIYISVPEFSYCISVSVHDGNK